MNRDIIRAMKVEQEYINQSSSETSLLDMITPFGYNTLDEYFNDKVKYQIVSENIEIEYNKMEPTIDKLVEQFQNGISSAFSVREDYNRIWLWAGKDNMYVNTDVVNERGYGIRNFNYYGGPIVTCNDDFNLALIIPNSIDLDISVLVKVVQDFLQNRGYDTIEDNNDLLLDGKKVLGSIVCKNDLVTLMAFELSLTDLSELIKLISLKESSKQPGYISNIKREELEEVFDTWLHTI